MLTSEEDRNQHDAKVLPRATGRMCYLLKQSFVKQSPCLYMKMLEKYKLKKIFNLERVCHDINGRKG